MDKIVSLCKRRGFVFQSSEIYGGAASVWDYGPLGVELRKNVADAWWSAMVHGRDDIEGLDAGILMHPRVWEASGHVSGFTDPLLECKTCKKRWRADHVEQSACPRKPSLAPGGHGDCELGEPRLFNLMFKTFMGPVEEDASVVYLRPETAQGSYVNFLNVQQTSRQRVPFGIAQVGKALIVPDGEAAKQLDVAQELWRSMLREGGKRDSRVVALGGGAVGDLAGFVAGAFLRGVEVLQLPTTLLAQVDASVGGKTAVDLPEGKNTVGLFVQPAGVVADSELLGSLPQGELRSGLFEVIKMGFLLAPELLELTEGTLDELLAGDPERLASVVAGAVAAKAAVVERDPTELDERRLLNFGHTLGHAIEAAEGYSGIRHGEGVGYGMLFALRLSCKRGLPGDQAARLRSLISRLQLPPLGDLAVPELLESMARDKKAREGGISWVLATSLGHGRMVDDVPWNEVEEELKAFLASSDRGE